MPACRAVNCRLLCGAQFHGASRFTRPALLPPWQVTIGLPNGRNVVLPVSEATCGAHVTAYVAPMLGCSPAEVRLWHPGGKAMLGEADQAIPGHRFLAKLPNLPVAGGCNTVGCGLAIVGLQAVGCHAATACLQACALQRAGMGTCAMPLPELVAALCRVPCQLASLKPSMLPRHCLLRP